MHHKEPANERDDWFEIAVQVPLRGPSGAFDLNVAISVASGSLVAVVGPSGAGKTTLLRVLAGLVQPQHGRVRVGHDVWCDVGARVNVPTRRRSIGFVFQDYALFPNMTVRQNVQYAFGSRSRSEELDELLAMVGLEGLSNAYPNRLSGGQRQRLALIRALARRPSVLMLDEPLSALDPARRRQLQDELKRLHLRFGTTTLLVSHDVSEIMRLADRVIRLDQGRVVFDGLPSQAFGVSSLDRRLCIIGQYLGERDDRGYCTVLVDEKCLRLRLGDRAAEFSVGDTVALQIEEAIPQRL